jgi:hypothetical protein
MYSIFGLMVAWIDYRSLTITVPIPDSTVDWGPACQKGIISGGFTSASINMSFEFMESHAIMIAICLLTPKGGEGEQRAGAGRTILALPEVRGELC